MEIFRKISPPWLVWSPTIDSGGAYPAYNIDELITAIKKQMADYGGAYVSENISGQPATAGVIEHFRDETWYSLLPEGLLREDEKRELEDLAQNLHNDLGLRHYSKFDFVVSPRRGIFVTNVEPRPRLDDSFEKLLEKVGCSLSHFIGHVIKLAREY